MTGAGDKMPKHIACTSNRERLSCVMFKHRKDRKGKPEGKKKTCSKERVIIVVFFFFFVDTMQTAASSREGRTSGLLIE